MGEGTVVEAGGWVFTAGHDAGEPGTGLVPDARVDAESPYLTDARDLQAQTVLRRAAAALDRSDSSLADELLRIYQWHVFDHPTVEEFKDGDLYPDGKIEAYRRSWVEFLPGVRPATSSVAVRELPLRDGLLQVDLIAAKRRPGVERIPIDCPDDVPVPAAGYSPAIRHGDWVFVAGTVPTDWQGDFMRAHGGEPSGIAPEARVNPYLWYGSPIETQTDYTLTLIERILAAAGTSMDRCVQAEVYIGHPNDFEGMDRVWRRWFPENPPARVVVPYSGLVAKGIRIEIAVKALAGDSPLVAEPVETGAAPRPFGHEPQAVRAGPFVFLSTQMAVDDRGRLAADVRPDPAYPHRAQPGKRQMERVLANSAAILEAAGSSLDNVCQQQTFWAGFEGLGGALEALDDGYPDPPPAIGHVALGRPLLAPGVELIAGITASIDSFRSPEATARIESHARARVERTS